MEDRQKVPYAGMNFLQDNEPMQVTDFSGEKVFFNQLKDSGISYNLPIAEFNKLSESGNIIQPGDIVSVKVENDFHRGKVNDIGENSTIFLKLGQTKEEQITANDLKKGDKVSFPMFDSTFNGNVEKVNKESIHFVNNSGVKFNLKKTDLPEEIKLQTDRKMQVAMDAPSFKGIYKFQLGQKFDMRELPPNIWGVDTKSIGGKDVHLLLHGKQTDKVYELKNTKGESYPAKIALTREDGKPRIKVNPKNRTLNLTDKFSEAEQKELLSGNAIKKAFSYEGKALESYVKVDKELNRLAFMSTDNFEKLLKNAGLSKMPEEKKSDLLNGKEVSLKSIGATSKFSFDFNNQTLHLKKETKENYSFKTSGGIKR